MKRRDKMRSQGNVYIEKMEAFEKFISDSDPAVDRASRYDDSMSRKSLRNDSRPASKASKQFSIDAMQEREARERELKSLERTREVVERSVRTAAEKKEKLLRKNLSDIEKTKRLLDAVDRDLKINDETSRNNNRRQFEEWNVQVHGKIQMKIGQRIDAIDSKTLNKQKNDDYQQFIDISNKKPAIFRDIIIESEYDPLEPNRRSIKAKTGTLKDPTLMLLRKAEEEARMLHDDHADKTLKIAHPNATKATLPVELWASGKIEGTPHGRFMKMMNTKPKNTPTMKSSLNFDDYNFARGKDAIDIEMPKGKRSCPAGVDWI